MASMEDDKKKKKKKGAEETETSKGGEESSKLCKDLFKDIPPTCSTCGTIADDPVCPSCGHNNTPFGLAQSDSMLTARALGG